MRSGGVAILFGAAVGVLIALLRHGSEPPAKVADSITATEGHAAASPTPGANASLATPNVPDPPEASSTTAVSEGPTSLTAPETMTAGAPAPSVTAPSTTPSATASPLPLATPLPPVTSKSELERAEIRCYDVDPEECGRAADAYDTGQFVPRDAARAERLRKVELTRLVRRCEDRSPHACLVLAGRYESGQGVAENDRHARALVEHARELCRRHPKTECVDGEPK